MTGDLLSDAGLKIKYRSGEIQEFSVCSRTMKSALVSVDVEKKVCVVTSKCKTEKSLKTFTDFMMYFEETENK